MVYQNLFMVFLRIKGLLKYNNVHNKIVNKIEI